MDNNSYRIETQSSVGIPYDNINWYDIEGQPFGTASMFNVITFGDANNIIDVSGAMAVGGDFVSPRGMSVGFGKNSNLSDTGYSPDAVRFLVGGNVSMAGPLVVVGHVVSNGAFRTASGSTYLIGKDGTPSQVEELEYLYQAADGSPYWAPTDKGDHYLIPSYDARRYIPASRIRADLPSFFQNARESIVDYKNCIEDLEVNGSVINNFHEWILRGNDPQQNVFLLDVRPNGLINKGIRAEVPEGSLVIVKLRTGKNAHLQYGLFGERKRVNHTLYVFEDATNIFMEVPADIWGSVLAPQAMFHGHPTGGHVSGNVALRSFAVNAKSGFEFHHYPFIGGVYCAGISPALPEESEIFPMPELMPIPLCPECPEPPPCPIQPPCPEAPPCPRQQPCPEAPPCPMQQPCPIQEACPEALPCPIQQPCPEPPPCPSCPEQMSCPPCPTWPLPLPCPICPEQRPCPVYPEQRPCPICPTCPEQMPYTEYVPYPVRIPCPEYPEPECLITPGLIIGCIWGCKCCNIHKWEIKLYEICDEKKVLLYCDTVDNCTQFEFEVPFDGYYLLTVCPCSTFCMISRCKPIITLKNVGVSNFMME
ncbi:MAG: hypothetical protein K0R15_2998 [Clostridiales bacterium]|jgi:choice-of-anchor A domain-containing protein|nr:hypothetical protein [Clostridiales bacterium]